ncbi:MAG: PTS glucose transporter subunit IIA, partial [Firmicutes bacterium]|nr:PTS glucose transporter subunit IIA [Bacillota bacterium]
NVRFGKPFICGCIGGAAGAMFASITGLGASGTGVTGIFGLLLCLHAPVKYMTMFAIAAGVSFALTWVFGYKDQPKAKKAAKPAPTAEVITCDKGAVVQPVNGEVVPASEIPDPMFAQETMGPSVGIVPNDGNVYAPFDGTITMVFPTNHAVGITGDNGMEVLVHVGVDTVQMNGKGFECKVAQGDKVTKGQLLMTFDSKEIKAAGYSDTVIVALTNGFDCNNVKKAA